jgi:hypothetical protein
VTNYFNFVPRFVRTRQDAQQTIDAYEACKEDLSRKPEELKNAFAVVKPPFKCKDCKRKITLEEGCKVGKAKLCQQCAQDSFLKGYQHLKRSEALTGKRLVSDEIRAMCEHLLAQAPSVPEVN